MLTTLILAIISFMVFLLFHVIIFHKWPPKRRFRTLIYIDIVCVFIYSVLFYVLAARGIADSINAVIPKGIVDMLCGLFLYFFIYFFYFHLIIIFDRSVTPRIMVDIDQAPEKKLTMKGLKSGYSLGEKLKRELEDMDYMGRIIKKDEFYRNTKKGITHAKVMDALRNYLHIGGHQ